MVANPLRCLIADDEPMALALLESYVEKTPFLELKGKCKNAFEVLEIFHNNEAIDLLFTDIQMPELSGMELSKSLPSNTKVIFTTAFSDYAIEGYKVDALDYLLKPFSYQEFLNAALKAKRKFEELENSRTIPASKSEPKNFIFIKSEYKQIKVLFDDILYIEGLRDYAKIYLKDKSKPILSLISLKKLEDDLPKDSFMRIHRSYIVALDKIESIERNQIIINGKRMTVSELNRDQFNKFRDDNLA